MVIANRFRTEQDLPILSFNFSDVISGAGYVTFYPWIGLDASGLTYGMSTNQVPSLITGNFGTAPADRVDYLETLTTFTTTAGTFTHTYTSEEFNKPAIIQGDLIVEIPINIEVNVSDQDVDFFTIITLYTHDGTSATQIATITQATKNNDTGEAVIGIIPGILSIPKTKINVGDKIQVKIDVECQRTAGSNTNDPQRFYIGHDPLNRDGSGLVPSTNANTRTQMKVNVPFRITE